MVHSLLTKKEILDKIAQLLWNHLKSWGQIFVDCGFAILSSSSLDKYMIIVNLYPILHMLLNFFFRFCKVLYWNPRKLFPVFWPTTCLFGSSEECIWQFTWCLWRQNQKLQGNMSWPKRFKEHIEKYLNVYYII